MWIHYLSGTLVWPSDVHVQDSTQVINRDRQHMFRKLIFKGMDGEMEWNKSPKEHLGGRSNQANNHNQHSLGICPDLSTLAYGIWSHNNLNGTDVIIICILEQRDKKAQRGQINLSQVTQLIWQRAMFTSRWSVLEFESLTSALCCVLIFETSVRLDLGRWLGIRKYEESTGSQVSPKRAIRRVVLQKPVRGRWQLWLWVAQVFSVFRTVDFKGVLLILGEIHTV